MFYEQGFFYFQNMELNKEYWDSRYSDGDTGWDIGYVSTPLKEYIDQINDKSLKILIPGGGSSYEAEYLAANGFTDITVLDISNEVVSKLKNKFTALPQVNIIQGDFFKHEGKYDLVLEQTFFCAFNPSLRNKYYPKMKQLLSPKGKIVGVMFGIEFDKQGPPFGGSEKEYRELMEGYFTPKTLELCYNSIPKRQENELFIILQRLD